MRRIFFAAVALLVAAVPVGARGLGPGGSFVDDDGTTHEANIEAIAAAGITKGCNPPVNDRYCPSDPVTRGQMAAFLVRALGLTDDGGKDWFDDDNDTTFEADINTLAAAGITKGCNPPDNTLYCPSDSVTRGQMAAFLVRAMGYVDDGGKNWFGDDDGTTFEADINTLAQAGVTKGCNPPDNTLYCPDDPVLRDQMASFLARALNLTPIEPPPPVWQPPPGTTWQWQLSGTVDTGYDVAMYDVDLFDTPQAVIDRLHSDGRVVICYLSAGSWEDWRPDTADFPADLLGKPLDGWPGEQWLDIRRLDVLGPIMEARLDLCRDKGFDGVEADNVDGYANDSGFPLTAADQLAYNRFLADAAHTRGLSIGLKNDLDQVAELEPSFDWALNEECFAFDECGLLSPFIDAGKAVFHVEYDVATSAFCPTTTALGFSSMRKHLELDAWREPCP